MLLEKKQFGKIKQTKIQNKVGNIHHSQGLGYTAEPSKLYKDCILHIWAKYVCKEAPLSHVFSSH